MDFDLQHVLALAGVAMAVAALAWWADRRRMRRRHVDAVGFMPWEGLFFCAVMVAVLSLAVAVKLWQAG